MSSKFSDRDTWGANPALLVVDMTRSLADPEVDSYERGVETADQIAPLLESAREVDTPIVFTRGGKLYHTSTGVTMTDAERGGWLKESPLREESAEQARNHVEITPALSPREDEIVITKSCPSAFFHTMLDVYLSSLKVDTVVVTGMMTSGCIRATVTDAFSHDLGVVMPESCVGDKRPEAHEFHMEEMEMKYGDVATTDTVAAYLRECHG